MTHRDKHRDKRPSTSERPRVWCFFLKENSAIVNTRVQRTTLHPSDHLRLTPHRGDPPNRASCHPRRPMRGEKSKRQRGNSRTPGTRDRDHAGPPLPPSQECRSSEQRWRVSGSGRRQIVDKLHGFLTPSSASLQCNHDQSASVPGQQLKILPFLVLAGPPADCAIFHCRIGARCAARGQNASQRNVHCQLCSMVEWKPCRQHLDRPLSLAGTAMFMSRNLQLQRTVAPASRHTLASVFSGAMARVLNLPEREHAARCRPRQSNIS